MGEKGRESVRKREHRLFKQIEITIIDGKIDTYKDTEKDRERCRGERKTKRV